MPDGPLRLVWWWGLQARVESWWLRKTWRTRIHVVEREHPVIVRGRRRPPDLVAVCLALMLIGFVPMLWVLQNVPRKLDAAEPVTMAIFAFGAGLFCLGAWPLLQFSLRKWSRQH